MPFSLRDDVRTNGPYHHKTIVYTADHKLSFTQNVCSSVCRVCSFTVCHQKSCSVILDRFILAFAVCSTALYIGFQRPRWKPAPIASTLHLQPVYFHRCSSRLLCISYLLKGTVPLKSVIISKIYFFFLHKNFLHFLTYVVVKAHNRRVTETPSSTLWNDGGSVIMGGSMNGSSE